MSPLVALLVCATVFAGVGAAVGLAIGEGVHQGDQPGDCWSRMTWRPAGAGGRVALDIVNRGAGVVVAAATSTRVRHGWLVNGRGRTTRRRPRSPLDGHLTAVSAGDGGRLEWIVAPDPGRPWVVVDLYVWQEPTRLRRHRRVLGPTPAPSDPGRAAIARAGIGPAPD